MSVTSSPAQDTIVYSEGLKTSYRNTAFKAAYPFGHGLSYTEFRYSSLEMVKILGKEWMKDK